MKARLLLVALGILLAASIAAAQPASAGPGHPVAEPRSESTRAAPPETVVPPGGFEVKIENRSLIVVTQDPEVSVTVQKGGQSLKIIDQKTGQGVELDAARFQLIVGGNNRVPIVGNEFTLMRGDQAVAVVRRGVQVPVPVKLPPPIPRVRSPLEETAPAQGEIRSFQGHQKRITSVAFSPDGRRALTSSEDGTVRMWEVATGQELRRFEGQGKVAIAVFSPDGRQIAAGDAAGKIRLWEAETGREIRQFSQANPVHALAFTPQGDRLLSGGKASSVRLWETASGREIRAYELPMEFVTSLSISPDGRRALCTGGFEKKSDTPTGAVLRVWDLEDGKTVLELKPREPEGFQNACFTPDGMQILTPDPSKSNSPALWSLESGQRVRSFPMIDSVRRIAIAPDGYRAVFLTPNGGFHVYDVARARLLSSFGGKPIQSDCFAFAPDSRHLLLGGVDGVAHLWRLAGSPNAPKESANEIRRFTHDSGVYAVAFSPDGRRLLSGGFDVTLRLWDVETGKELHKFQGDKAWHIVNHLAFSPDGRYALLGTGQYRNTHRLILWDVEGWKELRQLENLSDPVARVAFTPDGRFALGAMTDGAVRSWEMEPNYQARHLVPAELKAQRLTLVPGGFLAAYGSSLEERGTSEGPGPRMTSWLRIQEVQSGKDLAVLSGAIPLPENVVLSPDRRRVLTVNGRMMNVWDASRVKPVLGIDASDSISSIAFLPDSRHALSGGMNGLVRLWDLETGQEVQRFPGHGAQVTSVAVAPHGRYAATGSYDNTIRLWALPDRAHATPGSGP